MSDLIQTFVNGLMLGSVLALVAVGLTVIYGVVDIVNFAHGEFVMAGMYATFVASSQFGFDPLLAMPVSAAVVGLIGVLSFFTFVRPAMRGTLLSQIFVTFGLMIFMRGVAQTLFGSNFETIQGAWLSSQRITIGDIVMPGPQLAAAVGSLVCTGAIGWFIYRTTTGKALQATSQDPDAALMMGINPNKMFGLAWLIGGASTGVAAALVANYQPVHPNVGLAFGLTAFVIVALGGFGSIGGAFLAAFAVGMLENFSAFYGDSAYKQVWIFGLFILVMLFRPQGLLGRA